MKSSAFHERPGPRQNKSLILHVQLVYHRRHIPRRRGRLQSGLDGRGKSSRRQRQSQDVCKSASKRADWKCVFALMLTLKRGSQYTPNVAGSLNDYVHWYPDDPATVDYLG